ncbi:MAG: 2-C-methyl-D-erythritol 2,4-cyclodiphosphate synthase [Cellvibrionales bacterium TMED148]|nr:2-C-methyl-D-erythritol 2,4-cyclodiphosphate synthase [Porticoccaceae bacterium]RPG90848.1 MAG: 2-C-methyl-D-erythritol 2,4-cyclodiphosphate synthase [Cellvibrionales bacterium TMED148]
MRIGHGYDVHAFGPGSQVVLGGVKIPHTHSLIAHSDGDVVIHSLVDAILGALCLGDIGTHFPDTASSNKDLNSRMFLKYAADMMSSKKYVLGNADITVIAETPSLAPHNFSMRECLAKDLSSNLNQISVKATTSERLGFIGRGEGIGCHSVVILVPR